MLGGGSLPTQKIDTWCVAIEPQDQTVNRMAQQLREAVPSVIGRVSKDRLLLDMRTINPAQDMQLVEILESLVTK